MAKKKPAQPKPVCIKCKQRPRAGGDALLCQDCIDAMHAHFREGAIAHNWRNMARAVERDARIRELERRLGPSHDPDIDRLLLMQRHAGLSPSECRALTASRHSKLLLRALEAEAATREPVKNSRPEGDLECAIWDELHEHAYPLEKLAKKIDRKYATVRDGLKRLRKRGLVANDRKSGGYYRPDAPPSTPTT